MRYFFNAILENARIADPEGAEFADLYAALAEGELVARDIAAEKLKEGRSISRGWRIEIADASGTVHETVELGTLVARPAAGTEPGRVVSEATSLKEAIIRHHRKSQTLFADSRSIAASVRATFQEIRNQLAALGNISR